MARKVCAVATSREGHSRQDQAGQSCAGDGARHCGNLRSQAAARPACAGRLTFEDFLKEFDETLRQTKDFAKGYKSLVDAHLAKLMMERIVHHPKFHCNMTADEAGITKAEMAEIIREAETTAETEMKSMIERHARDTYHRLVVIPETPDAKQ
jgi:hypothetical protein